MKRIIAYHANFYGTYNRKNQLIEEMSELTQALCKHQRLMCDRTFNMSQTEVYKNILEEIADVEICLDEIKHCLSIDKDDIRSMKEYKLRRTDGKIEEIMNK